MGTELVSNLGAENNPWELQIAWLEQLEVVGATWLELGWSS